MRAVCSKFVSFVFWEGMFALTLLCYFLPPGITYGTKENHSKIRPTRPFDKIRAKKAQINPILHISK